MLEWSIEFTGIILEHGAITGVHETTIHWHWPLHEWTRSLWWYGASISQLDIPSRATIRVKMLVGRAVQVWLYKYYARTTWNGHQQITVLTLNSTSIIIDWVRWMDGWIIIVLADQHHSVEDHDIERGDGPSFSM